MQEHRSKVWLLTLVLVFLTAIGRSVEADYLPAYHPDERAEGASRARSQLSSSGAIALKEDCLALSNFQLEALLRDTMKIATITCPESSREYRGEPYEFIRGFNAVMVDEVRRRRGKNWTETVWKAAPSPAVGRWDDEVAGDLRATLDLLDIKTCSLIAKLEWNGKYLRVAESIAKRCGLLLSVPRMELRTRSEEFRGGYNRRLASELDRKWGTKELMDAIRAGLDMPGRSADWQQGKAEAVLEIILGGRLTCRYQGDYPPYYYELAGEFDRRFHAKIDYRPLSAEAKSDEYMAGYMFTMTEEIEHQYGVGSVNRAVRAATLMHAANERTRRNSSSYQKGVKEAEEDIAKGHLVQRTHGEPSGEYPALCKYGKKLFGLVYQNSGCVGHWREGTDGYNERMSQELTRRFGANWFTTIYNKAQIDWKLECYKMEKEWRQQKQ